MGGDSNVHEVKPGGVEPHVTEEETTNDHFGRTATDFQDMHRMNKKQECTLALSSS